MRMFIAVRSFVELSGPVLVMSMMVVMIVAIVMVMVPILFHLRDGIQERDPSAERRQLRDSKRERALLFGQNVGQYRRSG